MYPDQAEQSELTEICALNTTVKASPASILPLDEPPKPPLVSVSEEIAAAFTVIGSGEVFLMTPSDTVICAVSAA